MQNISLDAGASRLLGQEDPQPFSIVNPEGKARLLLLCDHAARTVPRALGSLGLGEEDLAKHVGWDIGAAAVTRELARRFDAPAVLSSFSRLVVDCNRTLGTDGSMPEISDHIAVPGNVGLTKEQARQRADEIYWPYHQAIASLLDGFERRGVAPAVVSIHSFTPRMNGFERPWEIGVLWDKDPRLAVPLMAGLAHNRGLTVGDNEPYSAREPAGFTLRHHAIPRGFPEALLELRQNEIDTDAGVTRFSDYLEAALTPILADPALYRSVKYI